MAGIPRRVLGRTGLEVSTLGYGAMELRGGQTGPALSDDEASILLNTLLDEGVNFIDTSIDYGRSEDVIGDTIAHHRDEYVLASKCGCVPGAPQGSDHVHTAENIRAGVEAGLRRLRTDHLDLVQFHRSLHRDEFDADGALGELLALQAEGKVRFLGVSGVLPTLDEQIDMGVFDAFQIPYSALQREPKTSSPARQTRAWAPSIAAVWRAACPTTSSPRPNVASTPPARDLPGDSELLRRREGFAHVVLTPALDDAAVREAIHLYPGRRQRALGRRDSEQFAGVSAA